MSTRPAHSAPRPSIGSAGLSLVVLAFMGYIDYLTHLVGGGPPQIIGYAIAGAVVVFREAIAQRLQLAPVLEQIPPQARQLLVPALFALWFPLRGAGESGAGIVVAIAILGLSAAVVFLGPVADRGLGGFYAARNRMLPRVARAGLAVLVSILAAFMIVHGSLKAIPVFFKGVTESGSSAMGKPFLFILASTVTAVAAFLLLREPER